MLNKIKFPRWLNPFGRKLKSPSSPSVPNTDEWFTSEDKVREVVRNIFSACEKHIKFEEGAVDRVTTGAINYTMAFGWSKNEELIKEYLVNAVEKEVKDAG